MNVYELDDGEQWWYAADSEEDAIRQHLDPLVPPGTDLSDLSKVDVKDILCPLEEIEVTQWQPESKLRVRQDDGSYVEKTAREWAEEGKGCIACTVW